jgi:hypothetical protein
VPWSAESTYRLPVDVWRGMVQRDFPTPGGSGAAGRRSTRSGRFKTRRALPTWDATIEALLAEVVARES